jgi:hypothetical protein
MDRRRMFGAVLLLLAATTNAAELSREQVATDLRGAGLAGANVVPERTLGRSDHARARGAHGPRGS